MAALLGNLGKLGALVDSGAAAKLVNRAAGVGALNPVDAMLTKKALKYGQNFAKSSEGKQVLDLFGPTAPAAAPAAAQAAAQAAPAAAPAATPAPAAQAAAQAVQAAQVAQAVQAAGQGRAMTVPESEVVANLVKAGAALPTAVEMATAGALRLPEAPSALGTIGAALTGAGRRTYRKRKDGKKSRKGRKVRKTPRKTA
jgi:hypothetical protein